MGADATVPEAMPPLPRWAGLVAVAAALGFIAFTAQNMGQFQIPFAWCGLAAAGAGFVVASSARSTLTRVIALNAAFVFLVPGLFEVYLGSGQPRSDPDIPEDHRVRDDTLGYRLKEDTRTHVALWLGDDLIYDVVYTTMANGLRLAPPATGGEDALCVLFFGGSFSYGTGVNDDETSPYLTGAVTGYRHRIHNLGYAGYGAHQMLAYLQSGRAEAAIDCEPSHVIYHSVHDHVRRAAGRAEWDPHGPRYVLTPDGGVERRGNFDDATEPGFAETWPRLARSYILSRLLAVPFEPQPEDYERFAAVVDASRHYLASRHPDARFDVILWNKPWKHDAAYWENLERRGITVHFIDEILPGYPEEKNKFGIGPYDGHPNPRTNELIARYVAREILGDRSVEVVTFEEARGVPE